MTTKSRREAERDDTFLGKKRVTAQLLFATLMLGIFLFALWVNLAH